jgi:hypothetical protein
MVPSAKTPNAALMRMGEKTPKIRANISTLIVLYQSIINMRGRNWSRWH